MTRVVVRTDGLDAFARLLANAGKRTAEIAREEFSEAALDVQAAIRGGNYGQVVVARSELRGGNPDDPIEADGIWPVRTGRSARAWRARQPRALQLVFSSNVRDPRTGVNYAKWARKRGEAEGQGLRNVIETATAEFSRAATRVVNRIADEVL